LINHLSQSFIEKIIHRLLFDRSRCFNPVILDNGLAKEVNLLFDKFKYSKDSRYSRCAFIAHSRLFELRSIEVILPFIQDIPYHSQALFDKNQFVLFDQLSPFVQLYINNKTSHSWLVISRSGLLKHN